MKPIPKYKPQTARVNTWDEVQIRFDEFLSVGWNFKPMIDLLKHIRVTGLGERLYPYTSMDKWVLTIYDPPEWNREALHIEFNGHSNLWHFYYMPQPYEPPERERYYVREEGIEKFDAYIESLKW